MLYSQYMYTTVSCRAIDDGGAKGTATITLTVTDVDDVVFSQATYTACIPDKSAAGMSII